MTDKEKIQKDFAEAVLNGMKTPEESLGITSEQYNKIVNECIFSEEPVSEDLEEAAEKHALQCHSKKASVATLAASVYDFRAGANWQKEQFEKNRLAACERQTREEADREQDFVMSIIENEHRQPTFSDAIEYGIRWQKQQMMKEVAEGTYDCNDTESWISFNGWIESTSKVGDKVKVIIVKKQQNG